MGEIVTLSFGSVANLVGAHFWNLQLAHSSWPETDPAVLVPPAHSAFRRSDIDHSRLMRSSTDFKSPRVVLIDTPEALHPLSHVTTSTSPVVSSAPRAPAPAASAAGGLEAWKGKVSKVQVDDDSEEEEDEEQQKKADQAREITEYGDWAQIIRAQIHHKSICPFYKFDSSQQMLENALESVRFFEEESDRTDGFHVLTGPVVKTLDDRQGVIEGGEEQEDSYLTALHAIKDENSKKTFLLFDINASSRQSVSSILRMVDLLDTATVSFNVPAFAASSPKELACVLDAATLPHRMIVPELLGALDITDTGRFFDPSQVASLSWLTGKQSTCKIPGVGSSLYSLISCSYGAVPKVAQGSPAPHKQGTFETTPSLFLPPLEWSRRRKPSKQAASAAESPSMNQKASEVLKSPGFLDVTAWMHISEQTLIYYSQLAKSLKYVQSAQDARETLLSIQDKLSEVVTLHSSE